MEKSDVAFQVLLSLLKYPSFEVYKVESMRVFYLFGLQPLYEKREVVRNFFPVENSIDHVAAKESHLNLVPSMGVYLVILMNWLKDVRGSGAVGKLQVVEGSLVDVKFIAFFEIFDGHILEYDSCFTVGVLEH